MRAIRSTSTRDSDTGGAADRGHNRSVRRSVPVRRHMRRRELLRWRRMHGHRHRALRWGSCGPARRQDRGGTGRQSAENASANSNTSMSCGRSPARAMTASTALWPAVSMRTGFTEVEADPMIRARGVKPALAAAFSDPRSRSAAPSAMAGEDPTVCRCSILPTSGVGRRARVHPDRRRRALRRPEAARRVPLPSSLP